MSGWVTIDKLSAQLGLTSRTLRHWEAQGLFESHRDNSSGWRVYDESAILAIQITSSIHSHKSELIHREGEIYSFLQCISAHIEESITNQLLSKLNDKPSLTSVEQNENEEVLSMSTIDHSAPIHVRFITLPPMRLAYHIAISTSPEEEAMVPVVEWLEENHLLGTARLFGGNMKPFPSGENKPYGYGFCASIPENVSIPESLKEMRFSGGLYAMTESTDDIPGSWQALMRFLDNNPDYKADHKSRLCFEEHIRNDSPKGSGNQYVLNLLEPVKKR